MLPLPWKAQDAAGESLLPFRPFRKERGAVSLLFLKANSFGVWKRNPSPVPFSTSTDSLEGQPSFPGGGGAEERAAFDAGRVSGSAPLPSTPVFGFCATEGAEDHFSEAPERS